MLANIGFDPLPNKKISIEAECNIKGGIPMVLTLEGQDGFLEYEINTTDLDFGHQVNLNIYNL